MSTGLVSSSRAVLAAAATARSPAVLDVLAPATASSSRHYSAKPASARAAPAEPAASSSKVRLDSTSSRSRGPPRTANGPPGATTTASKPPTAHARPNKQPSSNPSSSRTAPRRTTAPSASDLLSEMRSSPSSSSRAPRPGRAKSASQNAVWELQLALAGKRRDFLRALDQGWLPLRKARQVSRIPPDALAKLLQAVANGAKAHAVDEGSSWRWADVRELVVYAAGERDKRAVGDWAWRTLELGWVGAERVAEVWEAVRAGEHRALRSGPGALGANYSPPSAEFASAAAEPSSSTAAESKPPAPLFAAAVIARALLRARTPAAEREPFSALVAGWADSHVPRLQPLIAQGHAQSLVERHVSPSSFPLPTSSSSSTSSPSAADLVATLRQVALAQAYYARTHAPGLEVLALAREQFRTGRAADAWALWGDVRRAVEGDEAWMSTAGWDESGRERRYRTLAAVEAEGEAVEGDVEGDGEVVAAASAKARSLPPATLHQAVVSTFLAGFVQAQAPDRANAIWAWLLSRSPPLTPGLSCWTGLLHGYAARGEVQAVEAAFAELQRTGPAPDVWAWLERVDAHFAARKPDEAMRLARVMMRDKDVVRALGDDGPLPEEAWNRLQVGLLSNGRRLEAEALLDEMRAAGVKPSIVTVNGFLKSYTRGSKPDLAAVVRVLKLVTEHGLEPNVFTFTMVLQTLLAGGLKDATARTIAIMEQAKVQPTATTYGAIIHDLVQGNSITSTSGGSKREQLDAAVQLLDEMEAKRIPPTEVIYTSLIQGFLSAIPSTPLAGAPPASPAGVASGLDAASRAQHPYMVAALTLKQRMEKRGLRLNRVGYNAFLSAALALQSDWGTEFALRLFATMQRERAALVKASLSSSSGDEDEDVAAAPSSRGSAPSDTWYVLLDGFVRMGDFGRADAVVHEMQRQGFEVRNRGLQRLVSQVVRGRP